MAKRISSTKERLSEMMDYFHITQTDISKRTGIPKPTISHYCNGKRIPVQDQLSFLCDPYGINPAWLMGYDVPMFLKDIPKSFDSPEEFEKEWQDAGGGAHPNYKVGWGPHGPLHKVICTAEEEKIILAYRTADSFDQLFIRRILKLDAGEKGNSSLA